MILLIDNYDSFTYNLYHYIMELGHDVIVKRNDEITFEEINNNKELDAIIISPGPCTPKESGNILDIIDKCDIPIFGVCLGHQAIANNFGANIIKGKTPVHAKVSIIKHNNNNKLFKNIPTKFKATRYHSLIVEESSLSTDFNIIARSDDKVIQAIEHKVKPLFGVQFHPESIESEYGHEILNNFINLAKNYKRPNNANN